MTEQTTSPPVDAKQLSVIEAQQKILKASTLTAKQQRFVTEYLRDGHGTNAALRAGYSKNTAQGSASQLLDRPGVMQLISVLDQVEAEQEEITVESLTKMLGGIAFANNRGFKISDRIKAAEHLCKIRGAFVEDKSALESFIDLMRESVQAGAQTATRRSGRRRGVDDVPEAGIVTSDKEIEQMFRDDIKRKKEKHKSELAGVS